MEWSVLKPEIFASIMDFFASNVPILTEEQPPSDTGVCLHCKIGPRTDCGVYLIHVGMRHVLQLSIVSGGSRGAPPPPLFLDLTEAQRTEKTFS